jgi:hypothetical protein
MKPALLLLFTFAAMTLARAYPPYHDISDTAAAQAEARERGLPIAYVGTYPSCLTDAPGANVNSDLTQMALTTLQGRAVVITFDGNNMAVVPLMIHMQYHQPDDGPLDGGAAWIVPKIVFTDPGITKPLGRVWYKQMAADREAPIESALDAIKSNPKALTPRPKPEFAANATDDNNDGSDNSDGGPQFGTLGWGINLVKDRWQYFAAGLGILVVAFIARAARSS